MNEPRMAIVRQAFQLLDEEGKGYITLDTLLKRYNAMAHPRVRTREKTPEEVYKDFETAIKKRAYSIMLSSFHPSTKDVVTAEGFAEYYRDVNATLPAEKDAYFVDLVSKTWSVYESTQYITPEHLQKLEATMYEKVRQRTNVAEDEGKAFMRAMRYVDSANTGALTLEQFAKVLANIGCGFKPEDVQALFARYDVDECGKVCCDKIANYFALKGSGNNPNVKPKFKVEAEPPNQVLQKVKKTLVERGTYGIRGLGILFRRIDASGNRKIDRHEFAWAMKENGHTLSALEFERLFKYFDRNSDGVVDYDEFLRGIRGELNERRREAVHEVFRKLDRTGDGRVALDDLVGLYNVESHPKVRN